ncbi:MAG: dienelactone hydrolase family protein [Deltaproteobacteria bacterium]
MKSKRVTIAVSETDSVSAILSVPDRFESATAIIVAHGAGNDMNNPLLVSFCEHLAAAGYLAVRFNFPYKEHGRKAPDRPDVLGETWRRVLYFMKDQSGYPLRKIFAAGKSMGGRVASEMLARGALTSDGVIFLGYPLHPAGKKEKLRDQHLQHITVPMLFFAGTRDPLCDLYLLKAVVKRLGLRTELEVIEGGDHSFNLPKSSSLTVTEVYEKIAERSIRWISGHIATKR